MHPCKELDRKSLIINCAVRVRLPTPAPPAHAAALPASIDVVEAPDQANGVAEVGVRELKSQARVLRSHVEHWYKRRLAGDEPLFAWIVRHAANVIHRGAHRGPTLRENNAR